MQMCEAHRKATKRKRHPHSRADFPCEWVSAMLRKSTVLTAQEPQDAGNLAQSAAYRTSSWAVASAAHGCEGGLHETENGRQGVLRLGTHNSATGRTRFPTETFKSIFRIAFKTAYGFIQPPNQYTSGLPTWGLTVGVNCHRPPCAEVKILLRHKSHAAAQIAQ